MYDKFTDRARKIMQLANEEAQRYNHQYIGTEHILLGLVKEGSGVAANALRNLDVHPSTVQGEVERIIRAGPDVQKTSNVAPTPKAKKVIEYAIEEARHLNHNYVGTEHVLLGLLREVEGVGARVLLNLGLSLTAVRQEVLQLLGKQPIMASVQAQSPPASLFNLPTDIDNLVTALDDLVFMLQPLKESAVARQDFAWAAGLRDQDDKIRKMRAWFLANRDREPPRSPEMDIS